MKKISFLIFALPILLFSCKEEKQQSVVPPPITKEGFTKSFEILNTIKGSNKDSILSFLQTNPEVMQITEGDQIITFRLKNGPNMIVELLVAGTDIKGASNSLINGNTSTTSEITNVIGANSKDRNHKKALILAPHFWTFAENDDALVPLNALKNHRNYKGSITYKANEKQFSKNISFDDYLNIGDYDLIHISTHGSRSGRRVKDSLEVVIGGDSNNTETYLASGILFNPKNPEAIRALAEKKGVLEHTSYSRSGEVYLNSSFFREKLKNLDDKIIIFSACELGQRKDLKTIFENNLVNGQFFYWQNAVNSGDAYAAFQYLYEKMIAYGETATEAIESMPLNLKTNLSSFFIVNKKKVQTTTSLKMVSKGTSMHLIEPITILDPDSKTELNEGEIYGFEGIFGDGENEKAKFTFEILGYSDEEIKKSGLTLSLKIDGNFVQENIEITNADNVKIGAGKNDKSFIVTLKEVDLKKDLPKNGSILIEAFFNLQGSNFGYHSCNVKTGNSDMRIVITSEYGNNTLYFDADNYGLKMLNPADQNHDIYYDDKGFVYSFNPEEGWTKVNINSAMNMYAAMVPTLKIKDLNFPKKGTTFHYLPEYVNVLTLSKLENEPSAKKMSSSNSKKKVFKIQGVIAKYDEQSRLEELDMDGQGKILYFYEDQTIVFPNAKLIELPSF